MQSIQYFLFNIFNLFKIDFFQGAPVRTDNYNNVKKIKTVKKPVLRIIIWWIQYLQYT
jgi:hypothetical protein